MILNALIHNRWAYAETGPEVSALITEVMENLDSEGTVTIGSVQYPTAGEDAQLMVSDRRHRGDGDWPSNFLVVAVNNATGYGALVWHVTKEFPEHGGIYDSIWISDNPQPPDFDPRVVADPDEPRFHDPRSTLPVAGIQVALEEFCRSGTGDRPRSIQWVRGWLNGHRLDDES